MGRGEEAMNEVLIAIVILIVMLMCVAYSAHILKALSTFKDWEG
jgi:hypothetical protein